MANTNTHTKDNQINQSNLKDFPLFYKLKGKYSKYKRMTILGIGVVYVFLLYRVLSVGLSVNLTILSICLATIGVGICICSIMYLLYAFFGQSQRFMVSVLNDNFKMDMLKPSIIAKVNECFVQENVAVEHTTNFDVVNALISSTPYKEHIETLNDAAFTSQNMIMVEARSSLGTFNTLSIPIANLNEISTVRVYCKKDFPLPIQQVLVGNDDTIIFMELV